MIRSLQSIEGSCDLCATFNYFECVAIRGSGDLGSKRFFALFFRLWLCSVIILACRFLRLLTGRVYVALGLD